LSSPSPMLEILLKPGFRAQLTLYSMMLSFGLVVE